VSVGCSGSRFSDFAAQFGAGVACGGVASGGVGVVDGFRWRCPAGGSVVIGQLSNEDPSDRINVGSQPLLVDPTREAPGAPTPDASAHHQDSSERQADMSVPTLADENEAELKDRALVCLDELRRQQERARY